MLFYIYVLQINWMLKGFVLNHAKNRIAFSMPITGEDAWF